MKTEKNKKEPDDSNEEFVQGRVEILYKLIHELIVVTKDFQKIGFPTRNGILFYSVNEIIFIEALDSRVKVILTGKREIEISRSLNACEEFFHEFNFCRAHNSYFINVFHVKEYHRGNGGWVLMSNDSTVYVSNGKKDELQGRMWVI